MLLFLVKIFYPRFMAAPGEQPFYRWGQKSKTFVGGTTGKRRNNGPTVQTSASGNTVGGPLSGCKEADGFFILGMEAYKRKGSGTGTKNATSLGYQVGISQVKKMTMAEPSGNYNFVVVKGSKRWDQAETAFKKALSRNQTGNFKKFAGKLGWFCSNDPDDDDDDDDDEPTQAKGDFWSRSGVSIPAQGSDISDHEAETDDNGSVKIKLSTNENQITVNFYHKMSYGDGLWDSAHQNCKDGHDKYDNASSGWEIEYTEDASGSAGSSSYDTGGTQVYHISGNTTLKRNLIYPNEPYAVSMTFLKPSSSSMATSTSIPALAASMPGSS